MFLRIAEAIKEKRRWKYKNLSILRKKKVFNMKLRMFAIVFKGYQLLKKKTLTSRMDF